MTPSIVQTLSVPEIGAGDPSRLIQAGPVPMRIVVRSTGGTVVFLAHDIADLSNLNSIGATFQLPAGQSEVFVLAPGQSLMAASLGGGGQIAIAASEAFPVDKWMTS